AWPGAPKNAENTGGKNKLELRPRHGGTRHWHTAFNSGLLFRLDYFFPSRSLRLCGENVFGEKGLR
ncbi:MAG: hypothetical protein ACREVW_05355, partial [Burkholderiales bacterium]